MNRKFNSHKELFDYVRSFDLNLVSNLDEYLRSYNFKYIDINDLIEFLFDKNVLIIDSRSGKEFSETSVPDAVNFPVLDNEERHNVGLIYKNYSDKAALKLAIEYAESKIQPFKDFLETNSAENKSVFIYCWRGGGRSKYLSKIAIDLGYKPIILNKGIKSYRNNVNNLFASGKLYYTLYEISGLTGTGKTDLINYISEFVPALNLEDCARHYSSLFGYIPYKIRGLPPVHSQSSFENNIYANLLRINKYFKVPESLFIESESRKIGDFTVPYTIYYNMLYAREIKLECNFHTRVKRIVYDYFGDDITGLPDVLSVFKKKEQFFRKELSNIWYESALNCLLKGDSFGFTEIMLKEYYDKRYRDKGKSPVLIINSDIIENAADELIGYYQNNILKKS